MQGCSHRSRSRCLRNVMKTNCWIRKRSYRCFLNLSSKVCTTFLALRMFACASGFAFFLCLRWCCCCCSNARCCCSCSTVVCGDWVLFSISSGDSGLICCGGSSNGWVIPSSSRRRLVVSTSGSEIWDMLDAKLSRNRWVIDGVPLATVVTGAITFCIRSRNCGVRRCCVAWQWCGATCSKCVSLRLTRFKSLVLFVRRQVLRSHCLVLRILWRSLNLF
jgi:hypothetical protein